MVKAGLNLMESEGPDAFSVRKLATTLGCDPMAVLYHFKSKTGLERAMADAINAEIAAVDPNASWRNRLTALAFQYRELALKYPRTFPLLMRFWITGPADYRHAEMIYQALADAGLGDEQMVDMCFGWYASLLGLAAAEVGGLLKPATPEIIAEIDRLPSADFPTMTRLLPTFADQKAGRSYETMVQVILDGIEHALAR
ncbi:TetR/AcrR family transcriptional regulator [Thalassococcus sp. S3]|uniref:TetR/AcrR family transcriptional regulator n=1 Tax=Thalassococcus sp. S3 TaxID=2017482 RepID=UPI00210FE2C6|nr:TetR/AcrR family transcriptional regulator C-terminal domain-containing protein [Thalassococcus sp. S3]